MMMPIERVKFHLKPLVDQILDQLPPDVFTSDSTTFLDPAFGGGQFLREVVTRLRTAGHSDDNIRSRIYGCEFNNFRVKYAHQLGKVISDNLIKADFLSHDWGDMKFDVILGNPPYQDPTKPNNHNLWTQFVEQSFCLIKSDGHVAFVTPNVGRRQQVLQVFQSYEVVWYNGVDVKDHFQGVGSTFCSWVIKNCAKTGATTSVKQEGGHITQIHVSADVPFWPLHVMPHTMAFIENMTSGSNKLDVRTDWGYHTQGKKDWFHDTQTQKFKYGFQNTSSSRKWCSQDHDRRTQPKVICSKSGYLKPWFDPGTTGVTENSWVVPVKNKTQAKKVIDFLESDDVKKFVNLATGGNTLVNDPHIYRMLKF